MGKEHGDIDANAFQHVPYLEKQNHTRGYHIVPVAFTIIAPIGLYSHKVHAVADLPRGARIGLPNDPSNGGRGLLLGDPAGASAAEGLALLVGAVEDLCATVRAWQALKVGAG